MHRYLFVSPLTPLASRLLFVVAAGASHARSPVFRTAGASTTSGGANTASRACIHPHPRRRQPARRLSRPAGQRVVRTAWLVDSSRHPHLVCVLREHGLQRYV